MFKHTCAVKFLSSKLTLISILVLSLGLRLMYVLNNSFFFQYDQARDAFAVLSMVKVNPVALIGPASSIAGLFFGPLWYYMLFPLCLLFNGNPLVFVLLMQVLIVVQVGLAYKYFGWQEALIISVTPLWILISKSAWNPYPITLVTLLILIVLKFVYKQNRFSIKQAFWLGFIIGMGFQLLSSFAIFYYPILGTIIICRRIQINIKQILIMLGATAITFIPQALFEVRHQFLETKGVIRYILQSTGAKLFTSQINQAVSVMKGEISLTLFPDFGYTIPFAQLIFVGLLLCFLGGLIVLGFKETGRRILIDVIAWTIIPLLGFSLWQVKPWYVYGLIPVYVLLLGSILRALPKSVAYLYVSILFIGALLYSHYSWFKQRIQVLQRPETFSSKLMAIEKVREMSEGEPFSVYHYVPEIYDLTYQYVYIWQAFRGKSLPIEYSYQPNAPVYIPEKEKLVSKLGVATNDAHPKFVFYVLEYPEHNGALFQDWWNRQKHGAVLEKVRLTPYLEIYKALPVD